MVFDIIKLSMNSTGKHFSCHDLSRTLIGSCILTTQPFVAMVGIRTIAVKLTDVRSTYLIRFLQISYITEIVNIDLFRFRGEFKLQIKVGLGEHIIPAAYNRLLLHKLKRHENLSPQDLNVLDGIL